MNSSTTSLQKIRQLDLQVAILLILLGCVLFFFSFDRQIVSILKTTLMHEMNVSNTDYSLLITAFMLPYTIMYFFSGVLVDRYGSRFVITGLMVLMAVATLITWLATSLNGLLAGRVLLGMAESGIVPALTLAVFTWFKAEQRAFAFQLTNIIQSLGLIIAPPFIAWITLSTGWRWAFFIPSCTGIIISFLWFMASRRPPVAVDSESVKAAETHITMTQRYRLVLTSKAIWGLILPVY